VHGRQTRTTVHVTIQVDFFAFHIVGRSDARCPWALRRRMGVPDSIQVCHDNRSQRHLDQGREGAQRVLGGRQLRDFRNGLFLLWQYPRLPIDKYGDRHRHDRQGACLSRGGDDAKEYRSEARPLDSGFARC
jgi:hypothetical protein